MAFRRSGRGRGRGRGRSRGRGRRSFGKKFKRRSGGRPMRIGFRM